ncbi:MAG: MerR family transcriptional regulator [Micrococcus sp.]|nr:MerR family transcriptional regulator [Micrococcus sp.]
MSAAAEMAEMHPQTLRQYDRLGLVTPQRQGGRQRRYSRADVHALRTVQALSRDGVSLEGIRRIVDLQREVEGLQDTVAELAQQVERLHQATRLARVFTVGAEGDVSTRYADREPRPGGVGTPVLRAGTERAGAERAAAERAAAQRRGVRPVRALEAARPRTQKVLMWAPRQG